MTGIRPLLVTNKGHSAFFGAKELPTSAADFVVFVAINGILAYVLDDYRRVKGYAYGGTEGDILKELFVGY